MTSLPLRLALSGLLPLSLVFLIQCTETNDSGGGSGDCTSSSCESDRGGRRPGGRGDQDAGPDPVDVGGNGSDTGSTFDPDAPCAPGRIEGRVCAPSEQVWIGGADVTVSGLDCDGTPFTLETVSDANGYFDFVDIASGHHEMRITKGQFEANQTVIVRPGEVTDLTTAGEKSCLVDEDIRVAVVTGSYDSVETIVGALGVDYDLYSDFSFGTSEAEAFLMDPSALADYDIVMINCGDQYINLGLLATDPTFVHRQIGLNLRNFVEHGGSLYVSDLAYFLVEQAFPDAFTFSDDESNYEAGLRGAIADIPATIVDDRLHTALGQDVLTLHFPLQGYAVIEGLGAGAEAMVVGDAPLLDGTTVSGAPLLVSFQPNAAAGRVLFTSFHNESQLAADIERVLQHVIFSL